MKPLLVFVISLPRSGSTLLGHILGAASETLYTGEVPAPLQKGRPVRCRFCGDNPCPIWGSVLKSDFVQRCYRSQQRSGRNVFRRRVVQAFGNIVGGYEPPAALFEKLFQSELKPAILVDTSKQLSWIDWNRTSEIYDTRYILLQRDLRGVAASVRRSRTQPVRKIAAQLCSSVRVLDRYVGHLPARDVLNIQYEQLVTEPQKVVPRICSFLNTDFEHEMLDFRNHPSHVIGGNLGPVLQCRDIRNDDSESAAAETLTADERWKQELTPLELSEFERAAGSFNRALGYV